MNKYSAISWREKDTFFYEMIIRCLLCTRFSWIFIVLAHWNNNPGIDMLFHSDTLSWYQPVFGPLRHIIPIPTCLCSTQTHYPDTNPSLVHSDTLSWYQPIFGPLRHIILIPTCLCSTQTHYPDTNPSLFHSDTLSWYQPVFVPLRHIILIPTCLSSCSLLLHV